MSARGLARGAGVLGGLLALFALSGCQRKAPGPEACRDFALRAYGLRSEDDIRTEGTLDEVDELTTECLVTPYDRELLACIERGEATAHCLSQFSRRRAEASPATTGSYPARRRRREAPLR